MIYIRSRSPAETEADQCADQQNRQTDAGEQPAINAAQGAILLDPLSLALSVRFRLDVLLPNNGADYALVTIFTIPQLLFVWLLLQFACP